ncbi:CocE/NonD family hydrolase [Occultella kanbiaonis]|uniref:CocE/NonD family hydrolase n=1 Tax=Occultella kanbiaonis TaxID=2675754 RepID=UPI0013D0283D|nr:CocE/NonD family hydrolase [Occultella kanbiaonis]
MSPDVLVAIEMVEVSEGAALATEVIRVADGRPHPVLLVRTPYGRAGLRQGLDPVALARTGWAVVLQDIRGRWDSGGSYRPFHQDTPDGADVIAWCRAQPWCNGSVVMQGASYDGVTAWLAASTLPDGLAAIAPVVSTAAIYDPLITSDGTLNLGLLANWCLGHVTVGNNGTAPDVAERAADALGDWPQTVARDDVVDLIAECFPPAAEWFTSWRTGDRTPAWQEPLAAGTPLRSEGLPVYHLTGWFDTFVEGALAAYCTLLTTAAAASQRLVVGPWSHAAVFSTSCGDVDFGQRASGWDRFPQEQQTFLRAAAAGGAPEAGASIWVIGDEDWTELEQWPPPTTMQVMFAALDGDQARWQASAAMPAGALTWRHDPQHPVPTVGGRTLHPVPPAPAGPRDRAALSGRPDVVVISTEVLERDRTVMGEAYLDLTLTSETAEVDVHAYLVDVDQAGRAIGLVGAAHRLSVVPGKPERVRVGLGTIAARVAAGHRLAVQLASSDFPAHDVAREPGRRTISITPAQPLTLSLPIWDGTSGRRISP